MDGVISAMNNIIKPRFRNESYQLFTTLISTRNLSTVYKIYGHMIRKEILGSCWKVNIVKMPRRISQVLFDVKYYMQD